VLEARRTGVVAVVGLAPLDGWHGSQAGADALVTTGHPVPRTRTIAVTTSGRMRGRAAGGLADHLRRIDTPSSAAREGAAT
jgi:hypothetical protein